MLTTIIFEDRNLRQCNMLQALMVFETIQTWETGWRMFNELERMCTGTVVDKSWYYLPNSCGQIMVLFALRNWGTTQLFGQNSPHHSQWWN